MESKTKDLIAVAAVIFAVAFIASLIGCLVLSYFFFPQCGTKVQNVNKCNCNASTTPEVAVPTARPTIVVQATTTVAPAEQGAGGSTTTVTTAACNINSLDFLSDKWNQTDPMILETIAKQFVFFGNQNSQDLNGQVVMESHVKGFLREDRMHVSNVSGLLKQATFSLNGVICSGRDVLISYPDDIPEYEKVYVDTESNPREPGNIWILYVYNDKNQIVFSGWGTDLKVKFVPSSSKGDGEIGSGGGGTGGGSGGGGGGSDGGPVGGVPA